MLKNKAVNDIGNKFEEAYLSKEFQEAPSDETIAKWIAIAELRREERRRRNRKLVSLASILLICICVGVTCTIKHPRAVAGSSGGNRVESGMETIDVYTSYDEIPDDIKSDFLMFEHVPKEYEFIECQVNKELLICESQSSFIGSSGKKMIIKEIKGLSDGFIATVASENSEILNCNGIDIYFNEYKNGAEEKTYKFIFNNTVVKISTSKKVEKDEIQNLIKKAVTN
ncbi:MAG: hypothetical protein UC708_03840 [Anaerovoracaceae bacterium]|nr:hypothetical protein [Bacillota bacterium]MEE0516994.1 hypothetical protein [Anaerovoracaceae bacterium]